MSEDKPFPPTAAKLDSLRKQGIFLRNPWISFWLCFVVLQGVGFSYLLPYALKVARKLWQGENIFLVEELRSLGFALLLACSACACLSLVVGVVLSKGYLRFPSVALARKLRRSALLSLSSQLICGAIMLAVSYLLLLYSVKQTAMVEPGSFGIKGVLGALLLSLLGIVGVFHFVEFLNFRTRHSMSRAERRAEN